ncbi:MAG TPA: Fic family protein [Phycisphaerae bacterium]|nr:Fic family protein [Phycisphaerae bacterium]
MQPSDFTEDRWGRLTRAAEGYWAFVPNPLPPALEPGWELADQVSEADRALGLLAGTARNLPNPHLLIGPFVRREAVLSSRIEGTLASLSDLFFFEAANGPAPDRPQAPDVHEVMNYVRAMEYGLERLSELPASLRLIRELHAKLMEGVRGERQAPGEFRRSQNWIGPPGCTLMEASYVPPPVPEMEDALGGFEAYLHAKSPLPPLVRLALVHYQFEAIHPFLDGNGRIGRLLISLLLCSEGLLPQPLLHLSAFFERHRDQYYGLLLDVSRRGAWLPWILFFLRGVAEQSHDAVARTKRLLDLWGEYRGKFLAARSSALLLRLVDDLFFYPVVTIPRAAERLGITHRSAALNIEKMVNAGILTEVTGRERYKVYVARRIIDLVEAQSST